MTASLHGVTCRGAVTAQAALAWFGSAAGRDVVGYLYASDRAEWFRCDNAVPLGPARGRDLGNCYELFATDGRRQLRWTHQGLGTGPAVSLSEDFAALPAGDPLAAEPERTRFGGSVSRRLAGQVVESRGDWATLGSGRYARSVVPVAAQVDQEVWADLAEYVVTDEHGNQTVIDTLLIRLRAADAKERHS